MPERLELRDGLALRGEFALRDGLALRGEFALRDGLALRGEFALRDGLAFARFAVIAALLAIAAPSGAAPRTRHITRPHPPTAVLTIGRSSTMLGDSHVWDYATALFVDSTRGVPEAGYWRVPAGDVRLMTRADTVPLTTTPDIVNGVAYFAPNGAVHYVAGATYTLTAAGSDTIGAFNVSVIAPPQPHITAPPMNDTLARGADLVVTWEAGAPGDSVGVELMPHSPAGVPHLTHRAPDNGRFVFRAAAIARCPSDYVTMVTVTRMRQTPVTATGVRSGAFRAVASDYVHVSFRPRRPQARPSHSLPVHPRRSHAPASHPAHTDPSALMRRGR